MKYIFIIQGEGRGHLTQALALSQLLRGAGHSVVDVLVGRCKNRIVPQFFIDQIGVPITQYDAPTLDYSGKGKHGSVTRTILSNIALPQIKMWRSSVDIIHKHIKESDADVVINFYEFLVGVANIVSKIKKPIISIGHQFLVEHPQFDQPSANSSATLMLRSNNAITAFGSTKRLALSFYPLSNFHKGSIDVVPPLLRPEIFELKRKEGDFILGYMLNPAYLEEIEAWKAKNPKAKVHLFWDKKDAKEIEERAEGLWLHRLNDKEFLRLMSECRGYVTTAGFESVCEAMYLGKPTLMIPAHIEQQINGEDAMSVGAGAIAPNFNLSLLEKVIDSYEADTENFREWVDSANSRFLKALTQDL